MTLCDPNFVVSWRRELKFTIWLPLPLQGYYPCLKSLDAKGTTLKCPQNQVRPPVEESSTLCKFSENGFVFIVSIVKRVSDVQVNANENTGNMPIKNTG